MGLFGGGSDAAQQAQDAYEKWAEQAIGTYNNYWQQGRSDITGAFNQGMNYLNPYMQAGNKALGDYQASLGLGAGQPGVPGQPQGPVSAQQGVFNQFQASPGYQFALKQGTNAISNQAAAKGLMGSGDQAKQISQYGQNLANQEFGQYQTQLGSLAGMGQQAAGQAFQGSLQTGNELGQLGAEYAGDIGGAYGSLGSSAANSIMGGYAADQNTLNAWLNMFGKLGGAAAAAYGRKP